jgi:predicted dinucleotide-binding enzyme
MRSVSIIGVGRLGGALAIALAKKEYEIENLFFRNRKKKDISQFINPQPKRLFKDEYSQIASEIIFITTRDAEIKKVVNQLVKKLRFDQRG